MQQKTFRAVQPTFIGVFDTVATLGNAIVSVIAAAVVISLLAVIAAMVMFGLPWYAWIWPALPLLPVTYWYCRLRWSQWKYFSPDENKPLNMSRIGDWPSIWRYGHRAIWNRQNYDKWLDSDVQFARHALAINEQRRDFPRVKWAMPAEVKKTEGRNPIWLKQVWFAGCHSDVGGSYLEPESRLSDIALAWMLEELQECIPEVQINANMLHLSPDPKGMQHEETYLFAYGPVKRKWPVHPRIVDAQFSLHPTVLERLQAGPVSHVGDMRAYRPEQLKDHPSATTFFK